MTGTDGGPPTRTLPPGGRRALELYEPLAHVVPDIGIVITTPVSIPVKLAREASRAGKHAVELGPNHHATGTAGLLRHYWAMARVRDCPFLVSRPPPRLRAWQSC